MCVGVRALSIATAVLMLLGSGAAAGYGQSADDSPDAGNTVTVEGVGAVVGRDLARARDDAMVDAYRRALEAAGVTVHSRTTVENFQVLIDEITASASGYIQSLTVLDERSEGKLYRV